MLDPTQLETFIAVAKTRNFTEAARRLGLQQSTVSQHIRKLEQTAGRRLFERDTHSVRLTPDGEAMTGFAQSILEIDARARDYFKGSQVRGRVRFGTSEDFVAFGLSDLLRAFVRRHALVDLELTVGPSAWLYERMDAGELDLVLAKRRVGDEGGRLVWRDRLAWIGAPGMAIDPTQALPLILLTQPSLTRTMALEALERDGRAWRIVCTSGSLSGLRAAALAELGIILHARALIPDGLVEMPTAARLPTVGSVEFVVQARREGMRGPAAALAQSILVNGDSLHR